MTLFRGYVAAGRVCSGGPTVGAKALMGWFLGAFALHGARNDGIYACRDQRGSPLPSVHGEGRAADLGCAAGAEWAQVLADLLVAWSAELGIQCVIFDRHIWSGGHPDAGWRPYKGVDPHTTHLHVELSRKAAAGLTVARIQTVLGPHLEELMALLPEDIDKIAERVLRSRLIPLTAAAAKAIGGDRKEGELVSLAYLVQWSPLVRATNRAEVARDAAEATREAAIQKTANDLAVTVAQLGRNVGTGGIDLAALTEILVPALAPAVAAQIAPAVLDGLAARLQS